MRRGVRIYYYVHPSRILYIRRFRPMGELAIFHRYPSEMGIPPFTSRGNKDEHLNFSGKRGEMKKRAGEVRAGRVLFPEKYLYIFHGTFRVPQRHRRNYDDGNDGGILLRHVLEHLSPFAHLVTRVTSRKSIDSITLLI